MQLVAALAVNGAMGLAQTTPRATTSARPIMIQRAGGDLGSGTAVRAVVRRSQAAWYVGSTSAKTRIDFRRAPSGLWVRDFHFGSPVLTCAAVVGGSMGGRLEDGNFPLVGLRVTRATFHGQLQPQDSTPSNPYSSGPSPVVSGRFIDQRHVTGTVVGESRSCDSSMPLTFTATRVRALPARPVPGGRYAGRTVRGSGVQFQVSRSAKRVTAFRFARVITASHCDTSFVLTPSHSYPAIGLSQNRDGEFAGSLSSRLTTGGRPAGTRVQVSVLFLSSREATGTVRLLGRTCTYETLPFGATRTR